MGEKELFGEDSCYEEQNRLFSVICESSNGELMQIRKEFFKEKILIDE